MKYKRKKDCTLSSRGKQEEVDASRSKTRQLKVRVSKSIYEKIRNESKEKAMSISGYINSLIIRRFEFESKFDKYFEN